MNSVFKKNFILTAGCLIVSVLLIAVIVSTQIYKYTTEEKKQDLRYSTELVVSFTAQSTSGMITDNLYISNLCYFSDLQNVEIAITDPTGQVLLYIQPRKGLSANAQKSIDPKVISSVVNSKGQFIMGTMGGFFERSNAISATPVYYTNTNKIFGVVFVATQLDTMTRMFRDLVNVFALSAIIVLILTFAVSFYMTKRMVQPLSQLRDAAKSFALGEFNTRVEVKGHDEIASLGEAFNSMAESLNTIEKTRQDFIANVSHELKTPMTTIAGFVDGILDGTVPQDRQREYLGTISSETRRLSRLVGRLLLASKLQSGTLEINPTRVNICEIIGRTALSFERKIEEKKIDMDIDFENDPMYVIADQDAITQVIYNLVDNSQKYTSEGGSIRITAARDGGKAKITVFNTGQGIPKEDLPYVFERFYKADRSRGLDKNSFGLGLYIVKTIVNRHGEDITVNSKEGQYASFTFTLKLDHSAGSEKPQLGAIRETGGNINGQQ